MLNIILSHKKQKTSPKIKDTSYDKLRGKQKQLNDLRGLMHIVIPFLIRLSGFLIYEKRVKQTISSPLQKLRMGDIIVISYFHPIITHYP